ncbi:MAG: T9SS type A sorting domain-containing protein [Bacteroidota bacterium]|nr:T9SS type A sorting domain-containing protein [Bacteroidota bacterium]
MLKKLQLEKRLKGVLVGGILAMAGLMGLEVSAQCTIGQTEVKIRTYGGMYHSEKWVNITTEINGGGQQVWGQGSGSYGNGSGLLNNVSVCLTPGTYYVNCYDRFADGWDGTKIQIKVDDQVIADNNGESPNDGSDTDSSASWEPIDGQPNPAELEASIVIVIPESTVTCPAPWNLAIADTDLFGNGTLLWEGDSSSYELVIGEAGFEPNNATPISVASNSYQFTGLMMYTDYQYYVRAICDTEMSGWSPVFDFRLGYCTSVPTSNDGEGITSVTIGTTTFPVEDVTYYEYNNQVSVIPGQVVCSITFETAYSYDAHIWVDLNRDGVFDNQTEILFSGVSTHVVPSVLDASFVLPSLTPGEYKMRIGSADVGQESPKPCYSGQYGVTIDVNLVVGTQPCGTIDLPTGATNQTLTQGQTLADLQVTGENLMWYSDAALQNQLPATTVAENGTTYYVTQTVNDCVSPALAVVVTVNDPCAGVQAPTGAANQTLTQGQTLADLEVMGENLTWYSDAALQNQLPATTVAENGTTYYVTQTVNDCVSPALAVVVTVNDPCAGVQAPTGAANQTLTQGQTLADLEVMGENLTWYSDAALQNQLPATTVAENGTTYYVTQTVNDCVSPALAIEVEVGLSTNSVDTATHLSVYPNPVYDSLNIFADQLIKEVQVVNLLGQVVVNQLVGSEQVIIDMSVLPAGNYIVKVVNENGSVNLSKVVKN